MFYAVSLGSHACSFAECDVMVTFLWVVFLY